MKTIIWLIMLVSDAGLLSSGSPRLCFGFASILLGLSVSLGALLWTLRNAPEGYEDESGFHFRKARTVISDSPRIAMLRPHNAG